MKLIFRSLVIFFAFAFNLCHCHGGIEQPCTTSRNPERLFLTEQGQFTPELIAMLKLDNLYDPQDDLAAVVEKTQARWHGARKADPQKERSDFIDTAEQQSIRPEVIRLANEMGFFKAQNPSLLHYNYAICLGAFLNGVRSRLAHIVELWKQGIRFDALVFLTGERPLRKLSGQKDDYAELCDPKQSPLPFKPDWIPKYVDQVPYEMEYDMVRLIWEQTKVPEDMALALKDKVFFVNAPRGNSVRPSTKDTYIAWLKNYHPIPGTVVAPSDPLLWTYQQITGAQVLGPAFVLDTISHEAPPSVLKKYEPGMVSLIFDTVATCLYRIYEGRCLKS